MKISTIKQLAQKHELEKLRALEAAIENEEDVSAEVPGEDDGDRLTNVSAAIWIKEQMEKNGSDLKTEIRNYSQRVRNSISS